MDPNANVQEQERILAVLRAGRRRATQDERDRLAELRTALLDWLRCGGFEPDWNRVPLVKTWYGR